MSENKKCRSCGKEYEAKFDHCPRCLCTAHTVDSEGEECGGTLAPIAIWVKESGEWEIVAKCSLCGEIVSYAAGERDDPLTLLSVAARPLAEPPFPLERIEQLAALSGGVGEMEGYFDEQRK